MEIKGAKILIVDDEKDTCDFIGYNLEHAGFEVFMANSGKEGIDKAKEVSPHIILLDIMMPGMDGIEVCEHIRSEESVKNALIVFLTARGEDYSQIAGFDAGGDDYITKPVRPKVLVSRIKALLKRYDNQPLEFKRPAEKQPVKNNESILEKKDILIDRDRYVVVKDGKDIVLPKKEFELLLLLAEYPDKVFSRERIFQNVWGDDVIVSDRTIDVHIRKLREKLGSDRIKTIKGVGYKYVE
jgi:two-component system alkaline phosphatase synthesis response regulator PhoP